MLMSLIRINDINNSNYGYQQLLQVIDTLPIDISKSNSWYH